VSHRKSKQSEQTKMLGFFGKVKRESDRWAKPHSPRGSRALRKSSIQKRQGKEESNLGFLDRAGSGTSLLDVDDEVLERLVGRATHLSLGRKSSKGKLVKIPSCERFDALVPARGRTNTDSSSEESDIFARMIARSSLLNLSPHVSKKSSFHFNEKQGSDLISRKSSKRTMAKKSPANKDCDDFTYTLGSKKRSSLLIIEAESDLDDVVGEITPSRASKRKLTRNPSKDRLDAIIKGRRASISK